MRLYIRLTSRYLIIVFILYMAHTVTSSQYFASVKDLDPMTMNVIVGAVFGALTLVLKSHFETKINNEG